MRMGRPRLYPDNAARQRAYRQRLQVPGVPRRLYRQHSRQPMPPGSQGVARGSRWGNRHAWRLLGRAEAVRRFEQELLQMPHAARERFLAPLRGKDLWCYCPLGEPCHADVLLRWANEAPEPPGPAS